MSIQKTRLDKYQGNYHTPLPFVDIAYSYLAKILGNYWQERYVLWDMSCGTGNLEWYHENLSNVFMSTLVQSDIDKVNANPKFERATVFQYDYLNDDITDKGTIDYSITNKVPESLRHIIRERKRQVLVLINPPYGECGFDKSNIASNRWHDFGMNGYGASKRELFAQFAVRIQREIPGVTLAMFSTMKYVNAPNFGKFREHWKAEYLGGFVFPSKAFDGIVSNFPIGFLIWKLSQGQIGEIQADVRDVQGDYVSVKSFYSVSTKKSLNLWIERQKPNQTEVIPLGNALLVSQRKSYPLSKWSDNAIGYFVSKGNDPKRASLQTAILSSVFGDHSGLYITPDNLDKVGIVFSVRRLVKLTWLNHGDQFTQTERKIDNEFTTDCLVFMLFDRKNLTASVEGFEWKGKLWNTVNRFIPFTEEEVGCKDRFESHFMSRYLSGKTLSKEAQRVLDAGREIWKLYFKKTETYQTIEELKLHRCDVGWYQIRNALKQRVKIIPDASEYLSANKEFKDAVTALKWKLVQQVYDYGFLQR